MGQLYRVIFNEDQYSNDLKSEVIFASNADDAISLIKEKSEKRVVIECCFNTFHQERVEMEKIMKWASEYDGHLNNIKTQIVSTMKKLNL